MFQIPYYNFYHHLTITAINMFKNIKKETVKTNSHLFNTQSLCMFKKENDLKKLTISLTTIIIYQLIVSVLWQN